MSSKWLCLLMWTAIIAFLPVLTRLVIGQDWPLGHLPLPLEYLGWFFFFGVFVFMGHVMDIGNETAGAGVPGVPPNHRVYGLSTSEDRAPARGEGHQEWGCGAQVLNRESDLGRNNTHGGGNDLPLYAAATSPETHGGNDDPPSYVAATNPEIM